MTNAEDPPELPNAEEPAVGVSRGAAQAARNSRRKRRMLLSVGATVLALAGVGGAVLLGGEEAAEPPAPSTTTTSTTSTTTTVPVVLATTVMPLTGVAVNGDDPATAALLNRPALVAKVDNDPAAMPHIGLERADIVLELRVEGISRYMAVFHSQAVEKVGPVRSARTSDPDLLAMFGRPLFAWSGGNRNVVRVIDSIPFVQNENHDRFPGAYSRVKGKRAPHNLVVDAAKLFERADQPPAIPRAAFSYRGADEPVPGMAVPGLSVHVGSSPASFIWNAESGTWFRWANGRRHVTDSGEQLQAKNVVVLETSYGRSAADSRSPEAESVGSGTAWVFTDGKIRVGSWSRASADQPWTLTAEDGSVMALSAGNTWVEMVDIGAGPTIPDQAVVDAMNSSAK